MLRSHKSFIGMIDYSGPLGRSLTLHYLPTFSLRDSTPPSSSTRVFRYHGPFVNQPRYPNDCWLVFATLGFGATCRLALVSVSPVIGPLPARDGPPPVVHSGDSEFHSSSIEPSLPVLPSV